MIIRAAGIGDGPRIAEMARAFCAATPYGALFPPATGKLDALIVRCIEDGVIYLAETDDGALIVGMLAGIAVPHLVGDVVFAEEQVLWVEPAYRGTLVAQQLAAAYETWAATWGAVFATLTAPAGSTIGRWYEARGYRPVETVYVKPLMAEGV